MQDKVSIIVPVYNGEKYLEQCLKSIINQTHKNIQIIVVNDGSKDGSANIINKYKSSDSRIIVVEQENKGAGTARNVGLNMSVADWIMFVDVDDMLEYDAVENLLNNVDQNTDIVLSRIYLLKNNKKIESKSIYLEKKIFQGENKKELIESIFYENDKEKISYLACPFAKLYNRKFLIDNNIKFIDGLKYGEDGIFNIDAIQRAKKVVFTNIITYSYNLIEESITRRYDADLIEHYTSMLQVLKDCLIQNKIFKEYQNEYYYFVLRQINKYFKLYFFRDENKKGYYELKEEFLKLLETEPYHTAIYNENIKYLSIKRKLMLIFLRAGNFDLLKRLYNINKKIKD